VGGITQFFSQALDVLGSLFVRPGWAEMLDIAVMSFFIYQLIKLIRHTRANSVLKGLGLILLLTLLSGALKLPVLSWVLRQIITSGAVILVVLFQPEMRRALEQIGRSNWWRNLVSLPTSIQSDEYVVDEVIAALTVMSRRRVGALIVIEGSTGLNDVIASGTVIDALVSAALLENIFEPNTPLHDGAVIMRGRRVIAAGCLLQLSEDQGISRELGTRHRAALGMSETTDAATLIVSEETGIISMARGGKLTRYLDAKSLPAILGDIFGQAEPGRLRSFAKRRPRKA